MGLESASYIDGLVSTNPVGGSDPKDEGDDHLRLIKSALKASLPHMAGAINRRVAKSANYTVLDVDNTVFFELTASMTLALSAAATLGSHFFAFYVGAGATVTIDPNGTELINGNSSVTYTENTWGLVYCNGTNFICLSNAVLPVNSIATANILDASVTFAKLDSLLGSTIPIVTIDTADYVLIADASDSLNIKKALITSVPSGTIIDYAGTTAPSGYIACPTAANSSGNRTTHAALFAAIGTTWGAGDGSTTFGLPWFPADYATVQANGNVGTNSVGQNLSHNHSYVESAFGIGTGGPGGSGSSTYGNATESTGLQGGSANLAAGSRVLKCVKL